MCDCAAIDEILTRHADDPGALIPVLQEVQAYYGYLPEDALDRVARARNIPVSSVYGVATFYAQFLLQPQGETVIRICHGTACHVNGAPDITASISEELDLHMGHTSEDGKFTLESVACLGCCGLAPVVVVGDRTYGRLTAPQAGAIVAALRAGVSEEAS